MSHTPGPWWVCDGQVIQTSHTTRDVWTIPRSLADLRLMAAAPDLLEALRAMVEAHKELMPGIRHIAVQDYALQNDAPMAAAAAITKALKGSK